MSPRKLRKERRTWRASGGRRAVLALGWMALLTTVVGLALAGGSQQMSAASFGLAVFATVIAMAVPEPRPRRPEAHAGPRSTSMAAYYSHHRPEPSRWATVGLLFKLPKRAVS